MFESFTGQNAELYRLGRYAEKYNFDEASIDWIQSYLGKSKQCVKIESKTSELLYCEESVGPQGLVLILMICQIAMNLRKVYFRR